MGNKQSKNHDYHSLHAICARCQVRTTVPIVLFDESDDDAIIISYFECSRCYMVIDCCKHVILPGKFCKFVKIGDYQPKKHDSCFYGLAHVFDEFMLSQSLAIKLNPKLIKHHKQYKYCINCAIWIDENGSMIKSPIKSIKQCKTHSLIRYDYNMERYNKIRKSLQIQAATKQKIGTSMIVPMIEMKTFVSYQ